MGFWNALDYGLNTVTGAIFDLAFGRGGDGVHGSYSEQYQAEAQTPVININAETITQHVTQAAQDNMPPTQEQAAALEQSAMAEAARFYQEQQEQENSYWALRRAQEHAYEQTQEVQR